MRQKTLSILDHNHAMDEDNEKKDEDEDVKKEKKKKRTEYHIPEDGSMVIKDSYPQFREVTYPEPEEAK